MAFAGLTPVPPFRLRRSPLAQVLCQIRFSPILRLRQDDAVIPFQEAVRDRYPRYVKQEGVGFLITPGGVQAQQAQPGLHRFQDTSGIFTITLAHDFVALETLAYTDIDEFAGRLSSIAEIIRQVYAPAEMVRLGLRFINELRLAENEAAHELRRALRPGLLGPLAADELIGAVRLSEQVLELGDGSQTVLLRHGLQREGTTVMLPPDQERRQPGELRMPFYLLDADAFIQENVTFSVDGIESRLRDFNDDLRALFAWAVDLAYRRDVLGQDDDVA